MLDKPTAFSRFDPDALRKHLWEQDRSMPFRYGERLPAEQLLGRGSKFFILGKPGAGKTTFLKHLAVREAQRGKWGSCLGKIPIFVPLKQFAESGKSLFDFIVEQFAVCHFPDAAPFVERLLKEGKALVLFDGLDEVTKDAEARDDRRGQVTEQIEQFPANTTAAISSSPAASRPPSTCSIRPSSTWSWPTSRPTRWTRSCATGSGMLPSRRRAPAWPSGCWPNGRGLSTRASATWVAIPCC